MSQFDIIVEILTERLPGLLAVYLFGSAASDQTTVNSDLDIAILCRTPLDPKQRWDLQSQLADRLSRDVDLVDLLSVPTVFRMQVLSKGRLLHNEDPAEVARFETYVYSSYARLNEERRGILEQVKREGRIHAR